MCPGGGEALELGDVDAFVNVLVRPTAIPASVVCVLGAGVFPQAQPGTQGLLRDLDQTGKFLEREMRLILLVERHEEATELVRVRAALLLLGDAARVLQQEREQSALELLAAGWRRWRWRRLARTTGRSVEAAQRRFDAPASGRMRACRRRRWRPGSEHASDAASPARRGAGWRTRVPRPAGTATACWLRRFGRSST
jgi:hypothetical protein